MTRILVVTDIHYASNAEKERGDYESRTVSNPLLRLLLKQYRRWFWRRDNFGWNHFLNQFIEKAGEADWIIGNGDYCCDSGFIGVADDPSFLSAQICIQRLRESFGDKFIGIIGDHDLGKKSMFGGFGGMRLASWDRCIHELGLRSFFRLDLGLYILIGMNSTLIGLPEFIPDCPQEEIEKWNQLRIEHLAQIRASLETIRHDQRILLFLHDPSAIPHLAELPWIQGKMDQLDGTIIGHLHSPFILKTSRMLAGMPRIHGLGHTALKMSTALQKAKSWKPFKVQLVPAPGGIEISKKGGFGEIILDSNGEPGMRFLIRPLKHAR